MHTGFQKLPNRPRSDPTGAYRSSSFWTGLCIWFLFPLRQLPLSLRGKKKSLRVLSESEWSIGLISLHIESPKGWLNCALRFRHGHLPPPEVPRPLGCPTSQFTPNRHRPCLALRSSTISYRERQRSREKRSHLAPVCQGGRRPGQL